MLVQHVVAYILPGMTPTDYEKNEEVDLKVNKLTSVHTQLPYDYYSLKFCKPNDGIKPYAENLGELLSGDRIENSPYELKMLEDILLVLPRSKLRLPLFRHRVIAKAKLGYDVTMELNKFKVLIDTLFIFFM